jgi:hypothetical protein
MPRACKHGPRVMRCPAKRYVRKGRAPRAPRSPFVNYLPIHLAGRRRKPRAPVPSARLVRPGRSLAPIPEGGIGFGRRHRRRHHRRRF